VGVRWGLLSTARINAKLIAGAAASERSEIAAVASRDKARAEAFAAEHGIPRAHGSYEELLADPGVDAVYVPLPNALHVEWSIAALQAGKHVLCEKPMSRHPDQIDAAFDAAHAAGRVLSEAFMWRHHPQARALAALVADGAVGELAVVRAAFSFPLTDPADVRLAPELDGGALMDVGCYCVSGARLVAGEPLRVFGEQVIGGGGVDVRFAGTLHFPGDVVAQFDCGFTLPGRDELEIIGSEGSLFLDDPWHGRSPGIEVRRNGAAELIAAEPGNPYGHELDHMAAAILDGAAPRLGRADALGQARTIEALYRSADTGAPVAL
jgi:D-xylose 1-dehydrogenase (NADP+, D-xylono-1,5-lactone-forming)